MGKLVPRLTGLAAGNSYAIVGIGSSGLWAFPKFLGQSRALQVHVSEEKTLRPLVGTIFPR